MKIRYDSSLSPHTNLIDNRIEIRGWAKYIRKNELIEVVHDQGGYVQDGRIFVAVIPDCWGSATDAVEVDGLFSMLRYWAMKANDNVEEDFGILANSPKDILTAEEREIAVTCWARDQEWPIELKRKMQMGQ